MKKLIVLSIACALMLSCKPESNKKKITILGENSSSIQALMSLEADYEKKHPDIDLEFKPNTFDDAFSKSSQDFANKTGLYDVVMQYNFSLSSMVRNDYVFRIDDLLKSVPADEKNFEKDLFPGQWRETGFYYKDGKTPSSGTIKMGYPFAALSVLLMYNKEMFQSATNQSKYKAKYGQDLQVPTNWEDFYKVAEFFTNKTENTSGVCLAGATGGFLYYEFMNFLYNMDGKIMEKERGWEGDENSKIYFDAPQTVKALSYYKSLKPFNSGNFTNIEQFEQMKVMKQGKTAMALVWSDILYPSLKTNDGFDARFGFNLVPGTKSIALGGAFFINKQSKNPEAAAKYIVDMLQPATQIELTKKGLCSPLKVTYLNAEVKKIPYTDPLLNSLTRGGVVIDAGPDAGMISEVVTTYVQKVWAGELSPAQAATQAQQEIVKKRKDIYQTIK